MTDVFVGIDFGTSGCRACAIDHQHGIVAEARTSLPAPISTKPGYSEQNPSLWWQACLNVLDELFSNRSLTPKAISVDGTSGTLLLTDIKGSPLTPALMYNDQRAINQAESLSPIAPTDTAVHSPSSALAKLMYFHQNDMIQGAKHAMHQADWIAGNLCNTYGLSDENNSLKLGYDPINRCWPKWLKDCSIDISLLPQVSAVGAKLGELSPSLAKRWQCKQNVSVIAGTTDSNAATLASGISKAGQAVTSLGSTLVLKILSDTPIFSADYGIYSHRLGNNWLIGGASNTGGRVLNAFFNSSQIETLSTKIKPHKNTGLNYYPLLNKGERFPINDPELPAKLTPKAQSDIQLLQGLLEGIAHIEHEGYLKLHKLGAPYPFQVLSSGGGAQNQQWNLIRSYALGINVIKAIQTEACFGSALIAAGYISQT